MVLDLLVDDEEGDYDDAGDDRVDERHRTDHKRGDRRAGQRDQIENRDEQAQRNREWDAHDDQHDRRRAARDHADQQISAHVTADRPVDLVADVLPARAGFGRQQPRRRFGATGSPCGVAGQRFAVRAHEHREPNVGMQPRVGYGGVFRVHGEPSRQHLGRAFGGRA